MIKMGGIEPMTKAALCNLLEHDFKDNFLKYIYEKKFATGNNPTPKGESTTPIIPDLELYKIRLRVSRRDKQNVDQSLVNEFGDNENEQNISEERYLRLYSSYYIKIKDWGDFFQKINIQTAAETVFMECIKVLIWGGMAGTGSTLAELCELQKGKNLVEYLIKIRKYLELESTISKMENETIYFSSGWTKIYSFLAPNTCIYDSRVQGALNYFIYHCAGEATIKRVFKYLINPTEKERSLRVAKGSKPIRGLFNPLHRELDGVNANLVASWIMKYISEILIAEEKIPKDKENGYTAFKRTDEIMFMLGYDLNRLPPP